MSTSVNQRNVKSTNKNNALLAIEKAKILAKHTENICANPKVFKPEHQKSTDKIVELSTQIYMTVKRANRENVRKNAIQYDMNVQRRLELQQDAIRMCKDLSDYIDYAKSLNHLKRGKTKYWLSLTNDALTFIRKWHDSDRRRLSKRTTNDVLYEFNILIHKYVREHKDECTTIKNFLKRTIGSTDYISITDYKLACKLLNDFQEIFIGKSADA